MKVRQEEMEKQMQRRAEGMGLASSPAQPAQVRVNNVIKLNNVNASDAVKAVHDHYKNKGQSQELTVVAEVQTNSVLLSGMEKRVAEANKILRDLDLPPKPKKNLEKSKDPSK